MVSGLFSLKKFQRRGLSLGYYKGVPPPHLHPTAPERSGKLGGLVATAMAPPGKIEPMEHSCTPTELQAGALCTRRGPPGLCMPGRAERSRGAGSRSSMSSVAPGQLVHPGHGQGCLSSFPPTTPYFALASAGSGTPAEGPGAGQPPTRPPVPGTSIWWVKEKSGGRCACGGQWTLLEELPLPRGGGQDGTPPLSLCDFPAASSRAHTSVRQRGRAPPLWFWQRCQTRAQGRPRPR